MSECSGPGCEHGSHRDDRAAAALAVLTAAAEPVVEKIPAYKGRRRRLEFSRKVGESVTDRTGRSYIVQPGGFLQKAGHTRRLTKAEKKQQKKARHP